ncbi:hypothetical protein BV22DRAFT_998505, partial [Leucogyrophana mollusca]
MEYSTHVLKVRSASRRLVPVPIGSSIPRRDREDVRSRYSRLMLIFFKPWTNPSDLRIKGQSWNDAFDQFLVDCPDRFRFVMKNMQIFHECRDSRDD